MDLFGGGHGAVIGRLMKAYRSKTKDSCARWGLHQKRMTSVWSWIKQLRGAVETLCWLGLVVSWLWRWMKGGNNGG